MIYPVPESTSAARRSSRRFATGHGRRFSDARPRAAIRPMAFGCSGHPGAADANRDAPLAQRLIHKRRGLIEAAIRRFALFHVKHPENLRVRISTTPRQPRSSPPRSLAPTELSIWRSLRRKPCKIHGGRQSDGLFRPSLDLNGNASYRRRSRRGRSEDPPPRRPFSRASPKESAFGRSAAVAGRIDRRFPEGCLSANRHDPAFALYRVPEGMGSP